MTTLILPRNFYEYITRPKFKIGESLRYIEAGIYYEAEILDRYRWYDEEDGEWEYFVYEYPLNSQDDDSGSCWTWSENELIDLINGKWAKDVDY